MVISKHFTFNGFFLSLILITLTGKCLAGTSYPENLILRKADSLRQIMKSTDVIAQIDALNQLAELHAPMDFDSSTFYSAQALRLGTVHGYTAGVGIARFQTGNAYYYQLDFKNALISYLAAIRILEEKQAWKEAGDVYLQLGNINFFIKRTDKAKAYYQKALNCYLTIGDEDSAADVYEALCVALDNLGYKPIDTAMYYGFKLLQYARKICDPYREAFAMMIIGQNCITEDMTGKYDPFVIPYNDSALRIASDHNFYDLIAIIHLNLGAFYSRDKSSGTVQWMDDLSLSQSYLRQANSASEQWGSSSMLALCCNNLAYLFIEEKKFEDAEIQLNKCEMYLRDYFQQGMYTDEQVKIGYSFSKIITHFLAQRTQNDYFDARFRLALAKGDLRKAIDYVQLCYQSRDTLNAAQQSQQFELIMTEAEAEKTDQRIRLLSQDNELKQLRLNQSILIFIGVAVLLIMIGLFLMIFFYRKRSRAEQKSLLMEQRLLRAQMNPHFLFNSLASIQNYIINEKTDEATSYLSRFSELVRNVLENSAVEYVSLQNEVNAIRNYMELQKVRYTGMFDFHLDVEEGIDLESIMIPPMLAQPFIENAIEHGVKHLETEGFISIRFFINNRSNLTFEVEDNGVGRERAAFIERNRRLRHRSMSTAITKDRLQSLGKRMKTSPMLEIIDLKDNQGNASGTLVRFEVPVAEG